MAQSSTAPHSGLMPVLSTDGQGELWIRPGAHRLTLAVSSEGACGTVLEDVLDQAPTPRRDGWLAALAGPLQ
ncbi:MAG: hypothetical protein EAZ99_17505 [Alphaproteobacteria bacterium]|nr:hypothetical protein [Alphaproteobacteria bacterium]TAD87465.1 MAG: hypothetical protein EAZ99_17505 [Alphaproteobacteria bacterium]